MKKFTIFMAAIAFCFAAKAQVTVGSVIAGEGVETFALDFNNDGTPEFDVDWGYFYYYDYGAHNNVWAAGTEEEGWDFAMALTEGTSIGTNGNWIGAGDATIQNYATDELLTAVGTSTYMGFRFDYSGTIHYGWAEVTVAGDAENGYYATVSQLAYNATPNTPINAGQTTGGSSSITEASNPVKIYPNPTTDVVIIASANLESYELYDITGKLMLTETVSGNDTQINLSSLQRGIYIARVKANNSWFTQKIVKN